MDVKGFFDAARDHQVRGWAYAVHEPTVELRIIAEEAENLIGEADANLFRADLLEKGIGSGNYGFVINLSKPLDGRDANLLKVYAIAPDGTKINLPRATQQSSAISPASITKLKLPFKPVDATQMPVFVMGAARSGTSGVAQALLRSGWYEGENEGFVLQLLQNLIQEVHSYYATRVAERQVETSISRVPSVHLIGSIRGLFADLTKQMYASNRWIDKTPTAESVRVAPIYSEIFPNAKFIFMRRRALENVLSRQRKFPGVAFGQHCADWARVMGAWLAVRERLGGRLLEMDQFTAALDPDATSATFIEFLGIPSPYSIRFAQALKFDRPETTSDAFASVHNFADVEWSMAQKGEFLATCGPLMERYGYSLDKSYFSTQSARAPLSAI